MANPIPETGNRQPDTGLPGAGTAGISQADTSQADTSQTGTSRTGTNLPGKSQATAFRRVVQGAALMLGILAGFALTGMLFFALLALWSVLAGPFVRLQSASFVIVCALACSGGLGVWVYRVVCRRLSR